MLVTADISFYSAALNYWKVSTVAEVSAHLQLCHPCTLPAVANVQTMLGGNSCHKQQWPMALEPWHNAHTKKKNILISLDSMMSFFDNIQPHVYHNGEQQHDLTVLTDPPNLPVPTLA